MATLYHAHVLKTTHIIITKQCGGTPVSFAVVLLNLEHKQETLEIMFFCFTFDSDWTLLPFLQLSIMLTYMERFNSSISLSIDNDHIKSLILLATPFSNPFWSLPSSNNYGRFLWSL